MRRRLLLLLVPLALSGCDGLGGQAEAEADHALASSSYRFCHEAGLDADQLDAWCDVLDSIPEDRCPGLRASCAGAEPVPSTGCNDEGSSGGGAEGEKGLAKAPEPPDEPWSMDWSAPDLSFLGLVGQWLMALLVAAGIGGLLFVLWRRFGVGSDGAPELDDVEVLVSAVDEAELDEALPDVPSAPSNDLLAMARRALDEGRPGDAVVLARGAALRRLGELGRLRLHRSRTDREYVRLLARVEDQGEVPQGGSDELQVVVSMAERFRFGHQEPPSSAAADALAAAGRLLGGLVVMAMLVLAPTEASAQAVSRYRPYGDAAFADLYRIHGYEVRWRLRSLEDLDDDDADLLVIDAAAVMPSVEDWDAVRTWVERGHVVFVLGDATGAFPELGITKRSMSGEVFASGPARLADLAPPVLPDPFSVYELPRSAPDPDGTVGSPEVWFEDGSGGAVVVAMRVGDGAVLSAADMRFGDNISLSIPANEELLGELPLIGQAQRGWPIATPPRAQLAMRPSLVSDSNAAQNPFLSLARAELLPFLLQFLLLWTVVALWKGWPMGPLRDPPQRGRIRFADHVEALGERYERLRASRYALRAYAGLWLQRLGPKGLTLAATASGMGREEAASFVSELESLVEETDDQGDIARPSAREAQADIERMEVLWRMVEHSRADSEESP